MSSRCLCILAFLIWMGPGCASEGSYHLQMIFPDEEAEDSVAELDIWVIEPGGHSPGELVQGTVEPEDLAELAHLVMVYPPPGDLPVLRRVPPGPALFFVRGWTADRATILRGATLTDVEAGQNLEVVVNLMWVCHPGGQGEIPQNGQDDDCDGLTDECESKQDCDDSNPCTVDFCVDHQCQPEQLPDNTTCDDDDPCTTGDVCTDSQCRGEPLDCSDWDGICVEGACNPETGTCTTRAKADGTGCDDGLYCTVDDHCQAGKCKGDPRDCDDDDPCTRDECSEGAQDCLHTQEPKPGAEGPPGDATCTNGEDDDCDGKTDDADPNCGGCSADADCDDENPCTQDVCNANVCSNDAVTDGTSCPDVLFCTVDEQCMGGVCQTNPRDCSQAGDACHIGVCLETESRCEGQEVPNDTGCDDGQYCTVGDRCLSGTCTPTGERSCVDPDPCTHDTCNEELDRCEHDLEPIPGAEGPPGDTNCFDSVDNDCDTQTDLDDPDCRDCDDDSQCDDENPCTQNDCSDGVCQNTDVMDGTACDTTPPEAFCNGDTRIYYPPPGSCQTGVCTYTQSSEECPDGCMNGACLEDPVIFNDDFETGDFSAWSFVEPGSGDDSVDVSSLYRHGGIYSGRFAIDTVPPNEALAREPIGDQTTLYVRVYLYIPPSFANTGEMSILGFGNGWTGRLGTVLLPDRTVYLYNYTTTDGYFPVSSQVLGLERWISVELMAVIAGASGECRLWLDGNLEIEATDVNLGSTPVDTLLAGIIWSDYNEPVVLYLDDVVVDDATIGP